VRELELYEARGYVRVWRRSVVVEVLACSGAVKRVAVESGYTAWCGDPWCDVEGWFSMGGFRVRFSGRVRSPGEFYSGNVSIRGGLDVDVVGLSREVGDADVCFGYVAEDRIVESNQGLSLHAVRGLAFIHLSRGVFSTTVPGGSERELLAEYHVLRRMVDEYSKLVERLPRARLSGEYWVVLESPSSGVLIHEIAHGYEGIWPGGKFAVANGRILDLPGADWGWVVDLADDLASPVKQTVVGEEAIKTMRSWYHIPTPSQTNLTVVAETEEVEYPETRLLIPGVARIEGEYGDTITLRASIALLQRKEEIVATIENPVITVKQSDKIYALGGQVMRMLIRDGKQPPGTNHRVEIPVVVKAGSLLVVPYQ
jgi:hypothetical protein